MIFFHVVSCEVINLEFSSSVQGDGVTALMHAAGEDHADAVEAIFGTQQKCLDLGSGKNGWDQHRGFIPMYSKVKLTDRNQ